MGAPVGRLRNGRNLGHVHGCLRVQVVAILLEVLAAVVFEAYRLQTRCGSTALIDWVRSSGL